MIRHLTPADYVPMPWANGQGVTVEMLRVDEGGLKYRLSRAHVVQDGPFSLFPQVERNLTVLSGPGFDLQGDGLHLRAAPLQPVAFAGDIPIHATNVTTPCEDFNVMTHRALPRPEVRVVTRANLPAGGLLALFALQHGAMNGHHMGLRDLILTDTAAQVDGHFIAVRLYL